MEQIVKKTKLYLFDMDGTLYLGDRLYDFTYNLEGYEDGWITRETFLTDFEVQLLCGQSPDIWAMQEKEQS